MVEAFPDDDAESAWLLADLQADRAEHKLTWGDVGILYRTHEIGSRIEGLLEGGAQILLVGLVEGRDSPNKRFFNHLLRGNGDAKNPAGDRRNRASPIVARPPASHRGACADA